MPKRRLDLIFVGLKGTAVALERSSGTEVWRTQLSARLKGQAVHLHRDKEFLFASTGGEVFCLQPESGAVLWKNPLKGLGLNLASMVTDRSLDSEMNEQQYLTTAELIQRSQKAAASSG